MIVIKFEQPTGHPVTTRRFEPGSQLHIAVEVSSVLGFPAAFNSVRLELTGDSFDSIYAESKTNLFGHVSFDITLPSVIGSGVVTVMADAIGGAETYSVPIGIGIKAPKLSEPPPGLFDYLGTLVTVAVVAIAAIAAARVYQTIKPRRRELK